MSIESMIDDPTAAVSPGAKPGTVKIDYQAWEREHEFWLQAARRIVAADPADGLSEFLRAYDAIVADGGSALVRHTESGDWFMIRETGSPKNATN